MEVDLNNRSKCSAYFQVKVSVNVKVNDKVIYYSCMLLHMEQTASRYGRLRTKL